MTSIFDRAAERTTAVVLDTTGRRAKQIARQIVDLLAGGGGGGDGRR